MDNLNDIRAQLIRQQADVQACDQQLNATAPGTKEYGELRNRRQQLGLALSATKEQVRKALKGYQPPLL